MDNWFPKGERSRNIFIWLILSGCVLLGVARFLVAPELFGSDPPGVGDVIDETLGNIIATALAATALAWLLLVLFPPPPRPAIVEDVPAHEIGKALESALPDTKRWWFDGSTGRYQRATTLPEMGRWARQEGTSREVTIVILDPQDEQLCLRYANYREGLLSGKGRDWTVESVRRDLYATLLAALTYNVREPLTVTVGLKRTMSILRYDLSDSRLVITKEGRSDPAIACPGGSFFYDAYLEDLRWGLKQARHVDLTKAVVPTAGFDRQSARTALEAIGVYTPILDDDAAVDAVIAEASSREHPYS
jgi:hypothetical protein